MMMMMMMMMMIAKKGERVAKCHPFPPRESHSVLCGLWTVTRLTTNIWINVVMMIVLTTGERGFNPRDHMKNADTPQMILDEAE